MDRELDWLLQLVSVQHPHPWSILPFLALTSVHSSSFSSLPLVHGILASSVTHLIRPIERVVHASISSCKWMILHLRPLFCQCEYVTAVFCSMPIKPVIGAIRSGKWLFGLVGACFSSRHSLIWSIQPSMQVWDSLRDLNSIVGSDPREQTLVTSLTMSSLVACSLFQMVWHSPISNDCNVVGHDYL
ncbi:hypothetical protein Fot_02563 [Forsythia ovata]|uniref:Uncharacterized protein n=1 Tax=Forsythia ovata TaxID=205694 RepID=A0ABD1X7F0_9LAMI